MSIFDWLARRFPNAPLHHLTLVEVDTVEMRYRRVNGTRGAVQWHEIDRVSIRTTDDGPFIEDVFFVLETASDVLVVPQPAMGFEALLGRLQELPSFDNEAVIEAMACTDNREFLCWARMAEAKTEGA